MIQSRPQELAEGKIQIVLDGLRGESGIAELRRREGIVESLYCNWSKEFLEVGKRRRAGETERAAWFCASMSGSFIDTSDQSHRKGGFQMNAISRPSFVFISVRLFRIWKNPATWFLATALWAGSAQQVIAADLLLIDAHSQVPDAATAETVIHWMDAAGISHVILSFHRKATATDIIALAKQNPGRITPAVAIKGPDYQSGGESFVSRIGQEVSTGDFGALGEALIYHAAKGKLAPQISVGFKDPQFQYVLSLARQRGWPLILHIEFRAAPDTTLMTSLEEVLSRNTDIAFPLIHMGQLDADAVRGLTTRHPNVYFLTSQSNPITIAQSGQPWTNLFSGDDLAPEWHRLMTEHPDRFILAFDNVWAKDWGERYVEQAQLWRRALSNLPDSVAQMIGHQNAERLWHLKPN